MPARQYDEPPQHDSSIGQSATWPTAAILLGWAHALIGQHADILIKMLQHRCQRTAACESVTGFELIVHDEVGFCIFEGLKDAEMSDFQVGLPRRNFRHPSGPVSWLVSPARSQQSVVQADRATVQQSLEGL